MSKRVFEAQLEKPDMPGAWTYLTIPFNIEDEYGSKGQVKVKGTINGYPFRSSAMPTGDGTHYVVVNKTIQECTKTSRGSMVKVVMEIDTQARSVSPPEDFQKALEANQKAKATFDRFAYSRQKEYVDWIESAKKNDTRVRRIDSALERLTTGLGLKEG